MTGYGEAQGHEAGVAVAVEVRAINSRYFKMNVRTSEGFGSFEPLIEANVRKYIKRGTIQVGVRVDREPSPDDYQINKQVLTGYRQQLDGLDKELGGSDSVGLDTLLSLPGVVNEISGDSTRAMEYWPLVEATLKQAMDMVAKMRADEGGAMAQNLQANCSGIAQLVEHIERRAGVVVENYRGRLAERLQKLLNEFDVQVETVDVIREVGIFAERSDISEEIVRIRSHLDQFDSAVQNQESSGRKLEFLTQEMFRETNTIGSKANDSEIAQHVIEIKAAIERMREMIQNVE